VQGGSHFSGEHVAMLLVNADLLELEPPDPLTVDGVFPIFNESKKKWLYRSQIKCQI
jgi:hypothetical protein